jgi:hypothetical protein
MPAFSAFSKISDTVLLPQLQHFPISLKDNLVSCFSLKISRAFNMLSLRIFSLFCPDVAGIRNNLLTWQKLNITAFLMSGIGATQNIIGESYVDADGVTYLPMAQQPIVVYAASGEVMKEVLKKALTKEVKINIYTEELFKIFNDEDNRTKVAEYKTDDLSLLGIGMIGKKNHVSRLTKGLKLHE